MPGFYAILFSRRVVIQQAGAYEALVWDTAGDGSGTGSGGEVMFDTVGTNTGGVTQFTPSQQRPTLD